MSDLDMRDLLEEAGLTGDRSAELLVILANVLINPSNADKTVAQTRI